MRNLRISRSFLRGVGIGVFALLLLSWSRQADAYYYNGHKWTSGTADYYLDIAGWDPSLIINPSFAWTNAGARYYFRYRGQNVFRQGDGANTVTKFRNDTSAIATTYYRFNGAANIEVDTVINTNYLWGCCGESGLYDVMNVMTHEFGHWLSLGDLYGWPNEQKTMFGSASPGETKKRSLESDDINGIRYIYP